MPSDPRYHIRYVPPSLRTKGLSAPAESYEPGGPRSTTRPRRSHATDTIAGDPPATAGGAPPCTEAARAAELTNSTMASVAFACKTADCPLMSLPSAAWSRKAGHKRYVYRAHTAPGRGA